MGLINFVEENNENAEELHAMSIRLVDASDVEFIHERLRLADRLRHTQSSADIFIAHVRDVEQLDTLLELRDLLLEKRLVIVASNLDEDICQRAFRLNPRFITSSENGYGELEAVLQKMLLPSLRSQPMDSHLREAGVVCQGQRT